MKGFKKLGITITMVMIIFGVSSFLNTPIPMASTSVQAATIKLNTKKKTLRVKQTYTLKISGVKKKVTWTSSNKKVATVSSKGKVTAKKKGTATITAKVGNKKYTCKITVKNTTTSSASVYITNTGKKYHRAGCKCLRKSSHKISKSKAISRGYTACKVCKP